jgi:hypothetical protein
MFERLKKVFTSDPAAAMAQWANQHGLTFEKLAKGDRWIWTGQLDGHDFRMESTPASRAYFQGHELRLRVSLGLSEGLSMMVLSRSLKLMLEKMAYESYTDSVQTTASLKLTEEMRWLSMFGEVGWSAMTADFWGRYAVVTDRRDQAQQWLEPSLVSALMEAPLGPNAEQLPMVMMMTRGNLYLRTEHRRQDVGVLKTGWSLAKAAAQSAQVFVGGLSNPG